MRRITEKWCASRWSVAAALLMLAGVAVGGYALFSHPQSQKLTAAVPVAEHAVSARAFVDPDTGSLVAPTDKQVKRMVSAAHKTAKNTVQQSVQQAEQVVHRNGITIVRMPPQKRSHPRVEEGAQNHLQHSHDDASDRQ